MLPLVLTARALLVANSLTMGATVSTPLRTAIHARAIRTTMPSMASYYETIDGIKYDRAALDAARESISGQGDGRVSVKDAQAILATITDGGGVTANEFRTAFYVNQLEAQIL
ncbi:hypothetical protein AB1Y20_015146 [Prymnesium parvum]|uniref:EF-hand domain-containing protein n=1 Tax=Prymnesium parvum TaxID=97485 RepID=A0AB34K1P3_PRYPA